MFKTSDYLNLLNGNPSASVFSLSPGIYQITASAYVGVMAVNEFASMWITLGDVSDSNDDINTTAISNGGSVGSYQGMSVQAVLEIDSSSNLQIGINVASSRELWKGRLDIIKLSDYPVS